MRYMMLYKPYDPRAEVGGMPDPEYQARMSAFIAKQAQSGSLIDTGGLKPSSQGARVRLQDRQYLVMDGPFSEAKEVVGGYAIMQYPSKDAAIEATKLFLEVAGDGECEIRPLYEASDFEPPAARTSGSPAG